jgi:hypothetical protein
MKEIHCLGEAYHSRGGSTYFGWSSIEVITEISSDIGLSRRDYRKIKNG